MLLFIGDVQGCDAALGELLARTGFSPSRDRLVVLGDLVNRGPASLAVLRRLAALGSAATSLLGNHDLHLLAVAAGTPALHAGDTFGDVLTAPDAAAWLDWLRWQPLAHAEAGWLCVHAGVVPQWNTVRTLALAAEVQAVLRGADLTDFLRGMYSNSPGMWNESLAGAERWRFVVNVLTRIRFCNAEGELDFETKEGAAAARPGFMPWFEVPARATAAEAVAFGHWSTLGLIVDRANLLALDTGCVWGGALSAVRVDGGRRELTQVRCARAQRP